MENEKDYLTKEQLAQLYQKCLNTFMLSGGGALLWTNNSPNASFSPQTITGLTNLSLYKYLVVQYIEKVNDSKLTKIEKINYKVNCTDTLISIMQDISTSSILSRVIKIASSTSVQVYDCYANNAVSNEYLVPLAIYGCNDLGYSGESASTDIQINGNSITNNSIANIITNTAYNATSNKIATMNDLENAFPTYTTSNANYILGINSSGTGVEWKAPYNGEHANS